MSWVRWSTQIGNGTTSDLYIYDHVDGGICIHIAGRRYANAKDNPYKMPDFKAYESLGFDEYNKQKKAYHDWLDHNGIWEDLPKKYANRTVTFDDIEGMKEYFDELQLAGIIFPDYIYDILKENYEENI